MSKKSKPRPVSLTRDEVQLVQGYREWPSRQQDAVRTLIADVVSHNVPERKGGPS